VLYALRAWPYLSKPQLYAEDGTLWLSEGIAKGAPTLFHPYHGFFHTAERVFGFLVAQLPLQWAPLLFAVTAWGLFVLTVYYLLTSRTKILTNNFERIFMTLALALIANFHEFFFNFSNSIFLMGIIGALILIAKPSKYKVVSVLEKMFFLITSLTLTFPWLYLPMAIFVRWKYKAKNTYFLAVSFLASIAQAGAYLTGHTDRSPVTLFSLFSSYTLLELYNQIIIPAVRFARIDIGLTEFATGRYNVLVVVLVVLILILTSTVVIKKNNWQVRLLLFFLAGMTFASIKSPTLTVALPVDALKIMSVVEGANRYFVYGIVGVNLILVKASYTLLSAKARYWSMAFFIAFGIISSVHYRSFFVDKRWNDYMAIYRKQIDLLNSGKENSVLIPSNPYPWSMILMKN
jgi:hypothetical protein